ncbi:dihydropyrimidinase [Stereum hirsutum FP-91666 SS1]|uniref:dihydropyrimidinase n=1 Tax=Stereum hirsutum (strain FP-91666) TaxID=721885 RepID=R7RZL8_STEHR|nr:dihydropyrimidinase [Stereum hirsutum FP-91666 SS1]EIM80355.1 dihydropyrimidinase [Stereum hirsutum FP-91666 SS1]
MSIPLDLIIRNGIVVTASDQVPCDIGIRDGKIVLLMVGIPPQEGVEEIDAEGGCVTPGGVDSHVHVAQSAAKALGAQSADDWESGTRSALAGGTTTILAFAVQNRGDSLSVAASNYHTLSDDHSLCDFGFHLIVTDPNYEQMHVELPALVERGITSVKIYMTYAALKLNDGQILDVLLAARKYGVTTMVHCENADVIDWMTKSLESRGMTQPWHHGTSRPPLVESEATHRALSLSELLDTPILIVHVSAPDAVSHIRKAQTRLLPVYAETCPHYAVLDGRAMRTGGIHREGEGEEGRFEGAKCVCAPPLRDDPRDKERIWEGLANGTFTVFSSDHAPTRFNDPRGKQLGLTADPTKHAHGLGNFRYIPNGLPGVETRTPILWSEGVLKRRISPQRFVELNSTNAAKLYGMYPQKGTIQPGSDADLIIWRPAHKRKPYTISQSKLHHGADYTPYEGLVLEDWPRYTILRGKVVYDGETNEVLAKPGNGKFLVRGKSSLPGPRNVWLSEWRPE